MGLCFNSCVDLDLKPKGQYSEAEFFGTVGGVQVFFTTIYGYLPIEDFHYTHNNDGGYRWRNGDDAWGTWEAPKFMLQKHAAEFINSWDPRLNNDGPNYWPYDRIREVNSFIASFENYKSDFSEDVYNSLLGEAYFLRAFLYSGMVKRYGGVPIVKNVLYPNQPLEETQLPRNTEYECWKFIQEDLDFAIKNMSADVNIYRANRWTALMLQSRLMLYAGTIAKYSRYLNWDGLEAYDGGFACMKGNEDKADEFFQAAYDAADRLIKGPHKLYNAHADKATNFYRLFFDKGSSETILTKNYVHHDEFKREAFLIGHSWDALMLPKGTGMSGFVGSNNYPCLDMMRLYEGFPELNNANGTPKRWDTRYQMFQESEMEPRMRGCMYFNGDQIRGATFDLQRGVYRTFTWKGRIVDESGNELGDIINGSDSDTPNTPATGTGGNRYVTGTRDAKTSAADGEVRILGEHGMAKAGGENNNLTGGFVRKYVKEDDGFVPAEHNNFQHWVVFRLGEAYLNLAEAAYELGMKKEANDAIRAIRERAGCKNLDISEKIEDVNRYELEKTEENYGVGNMPIGLQFIRDERNRELWGENHRWWDIRRWRSADRVLNQWRPRIVSCYYVLDEEKYIYLDEQEMDARSWNFEKKAYYQGIPDGEINKNPNLLPRNPLR